MVCSIAVTLTASGFSWSPPTVCFGLPQPRSSKATAVTHTTETQPPYVLGNYPRVELEFRCAAPTTTADAAVRECDENRKRGELKSFKAAVECSNPKIYSVWKEAGDPNFDLLNVWLAARLVGAEKVDKKQVTEAEYWNWPNWILGSQTKSADEALQTLKCN